MTQGASKRGSGFEHSAGGVVYRQNESGVEVCLIQPKGTVRWQLPKGHVEADEEVSMAALRESSEETGLTCDLESFIDSIEYTFYNRFKKEQANKQIHKQVAFYLVKATGGRSVSK